VRATEARPLLEQAGFLGARDRGAARLIAARRPEAGVKERRQAGNPAKNRGSPPSQAHLTLVAWTLFIPTVPGTVWPPAPVGKASPLRWQGALIFQSWQSSLPLATLPPKPATPPFG
jgi:hypothetical protein